MATCPRCGAYLADRHRCARVWRLWARVAARIIAGAGIAAAFSTTLSRLVFNSFSPSSTVAWALVGAVVSYSLIAGEPRF